MTLGAIGIGSGLVLGAAASVLGTRYLLAALWLRQGRLRAIIVGVSGGLIAAPWALFLSLVVGASLGGSLGGLIGESLGTASGGAVTGLAIGVALVFRTIMLAGVSLGLLASTWVTRHT